MNPTMTSFSTTLASPVGALGVSVDADGRLIGIQFLGARRPAGERRDDRRCAHVVEQLREYFAGRRTSFDLEVAPAGTPFQLEVWRALGAIAYGTTISYGELARRLGRPGAMRAVGAANGKNPIPIVVPCHRVIGADGSLTGFGGGLSCKRVLLELEGLEVEGRAPRARAGDRVHPALARA